MAPETGDRPEHTGPLAHLRQALSHAEGAVRCYLTLLAAQVKRHVAAAVREAAWAVALVALALLGITLLVCGLATYIESRAGVPGSGPMLVGGAVLAAVLVALVARSRRSGK